MISVEDAVKILRKGQMYLKPISNGECKEIADLIEHLANKCDLEVNELLDGDANANN